MVATSNPKILAVDTSSQAGSVALLQGETLIAESFFAVRKTHSELLLQQIESLLLETGWTLADLDLLAAVHGPGSFTGLRIGVATIKGLAQSVACPVVGISSLEMLAMNLPYCSLPVCVLMDARKKEVYTQVFHCSESGPQALGSAQVVSAERALTSLSGPVVLLGDAVPVYRTLITEMLGDRAHFLPVTASQPRAAQAAWLAYRSWLDGDCLSAADLLPVYIRPSDAELNLQSK